MDSFKSIGAKIRKFFSCVPCVVWVHILTLLLMCTVGAVIVAMLANPEFATQIFGLILILAIIGFVLYLAFQVYIMIFELICDFLDNWFNR